MMPNLLRRMLAVAAVAAALPLAACASKPEPKMISDNQCLGVADALKTLQPGDPLPRVVQVVGKPDRTYRVRAPFGRSYDVIEYDVGKTSCAAVLLNSVNKLSILFDEKGGMVGSGRDMFRRLQQATAVHVGSVPVDFDQIGE